MSRPKENKIADLKGETALAVKSGRKLSDASWRPCRIILSDKRILVITSSDKTSIPLSELKSIKGRFDSNSEIATKKEYIPLVQQSDSGKRVRLVTASKQSSVEKLQHKLQQTLLNGIFAQVKHPAIKGGVVKDTGWIKGKMKLAEEGVNIGLESGKMVSIEYADISSTKTESRSVNGSEKRILEVEHADEESVVETYLYGHKNIHRHLSPILSEKAKKQQGEIELDSFERQLITGLYSGLNPFELPEFLGADVDKVEEVYQDLIERGVLEKVRMRREVALTTRGRNLASEAINQ